MDASLHVETPLSRFYTSLLFSTLYGLVVQSPALSAILNRDVFLKLENLQPGGSFKIRGIGHTMQVRISAPRLNRKLSTSRRQSGVAPRSLWAAAAVTRAWPWRWPPRRSGSL